MICLRNFVDNISTIPNLVSPSKSIMIFKLPSFRAVDKVNETRKSYIVYEGIERDNGTKHVVVNEVQWKRTTRSTRQLDFELEVIGKEQEMNPIGLDAVHVQVLPLTQPSSAASSGRGTAASPQVSKALICFCFYDAPQPSSCIR